MKRMATILSAVIGVAPAAGVAAQRGETRTLPALSPPIVSVWATPLAVTVSWKPVDGAGSYTVEQALSPSGPWTALMLDPKGGTEVTAPAAALNYAAGGMLYYYRVTALFPVGLRGEVPLGIPGVTIVPRVTPRLNEPLGVDPRQEGTDVRVSWAPVPYATGYLVKVAMGTQQSLVGSTEVNAPFTEARLVNVLPPSGSTQPYWVSVAARYWPGGVLSVATTKNSTATPFQECWVPVPILGPAPIVSLTSQGPSIYGVHASSSATDASPIRVERAPMGSATWQSAGCTFGFGSGSGIHDEGLTPGTPYSYRVTKIVAGVAGQTVVNTVTAAAPESPVPTATLGACTDAGCKVTLNWFGFAGATDYRIESSYGLYQPQMMPIGYYGVRAAGPLSQTLSLVPRGVHTFTLTPLFSLMRQSPKPPGQVTVVVP